jgi:GrpB-like predicted nucleotidyltransferase (UPF0157 family)
MADPASITIIEQVPYDPGWKESYQKESTTLREALGDEVISIHHIGSTSIPGITAKPVIDILVGVRKIEDIDHYNDAMARIGYEARGEFGLPGRRFFVKGVPKRKYNVHIYQADDMEMGRHLAFRDYMIDHPDDAKEYSELKQRLALQYKGDMDGYCDGKDAFVKDMEKKAIAWARNR